MDHDLIVVGSGSVGASLARAVRGAASVRLLAREARPLARPEGFDARVYALSPANAAFAGLDPSSLTPVHSMRVFGDRGAEIGFDAYRAGVPALAYIVEDSVLQEALQPGLETEVGTVASLSVDEAGVRVRLEGGRELGAKLVVAADGADSSVRDLAGIEASVRSYGQSAVVANFACERAHANTAFQWFQGGPVLALLPLRGNHVSMVWSQSNEEAQRLAALQGDTLCRELEHATRHALGDLALVTPPRCFPLRRVAAQRMIAPRVALVGDAAHVVHPLAGQGLNLGLQDARTLSQVLRTREPVRDAGDWSLLRRYERARAAPILAMDTMIDTLQKLFGASGGFTATLRNRGLNLTDRLEVVKNLFIRQAMS